MTYPAYSYAAPVYSAAPVVAQQQILHHYAAPVNGVLAKAQAKLAALGYYKGVVDGIYGQQTANAVQQFQAENNLSVSGRLDLKTLAGLGITL